MTARRNPCLIILTLGLLFADPGLAWMGVVGWTVLSTVIMAIRLLYAAYVRMREGPLDSWLRDGDAAARAYPRSWQQFSTTRGAYGAGQGAHDPTR